VVSEDPNVYIFIECVVELYASKLSAGLGIFEMADPVNRGINIPRLEEDIFTWAQDKSSDEPTPMLSRE
jgi:hypothetical protein